ncbi:MAG: response regulator [Chlorobium sp.]|nr:response regulator [Chlorobium sp.]MCF8217331.1 response regulator [Chlorobium sp.]MCF8272175.1 response regulator [Chlorobium sp.]MCF8288544.1 response regulator [Chlorobium sp.]MCF8292140.1 response regulator [Chlorobium sp.]
MNYSGYLESRPDARIYISFQTGERYNSVKIRDTGPGISRENLSRLFDPYFTASKKGGTGLGLSYCKRVMHAFDGDIVCLSTEGKYTEFILTFPVVTADELKVSHDKLIHDNRQLFNKKNILVVDDNAKDRKVVKEVLVHLDVVVDEAANGQEALEKIRIASYDLVIMNLAMPVLDGYEATEMIRSGHIGQKAAGIPIIGYTEQPYAVVRGKTNKVGMQELITKPLMESDLVMKIAAVFHEYHGISLQKIGGKSVLIADDSAVNRIGLIMILEKYGIKAEGAVNGKDAYEKLERGTFDLVLMDIGMPQLNGIEATKMIRNSAIPKVVTVPVIGFSGESDEQLIREALAAGMNDYLIKPVDIRLLLEKISQTL